MLDEPGEVNPVLDEWSDGFERQASLLGFNAHRVWLDRHARRVHRFCKQKYGIHDWEDSYRELYNTNPWKLRALVEDFNRYNGDKVRTFVDFLAHSESVIGMLEGGRGEGKTTSAWTIAARVSAQGRKVDVLGLQRRIPVWPARYGPPARQIFDLKEARPESLVIIDESAQLFNSRESQKKDSRGLPALLAILRQMQASALVITQNSSITDIAFSKFLDYVWLKPLSFAQSQYSRPEGRRFHEKWRELLPTSKEWNFILGKRIPPTSFYLERAEWLTMEDSRAYRPYQNPVEALPHAIKMRGLRWDWERIAASLKTMGADLQPIEWAGLVMQACGRDPGSFVAAVTPEEVATALPKKALAGAFPAEEDL